MKRTGFLTVETDIRIAKDKLIIHPNDGYDLGLLNRHYNVGMYFNEKIEVFGESDGPASSGSIFLENECRHGAIAMSKKQWQELGQPEKVMLVYNEGNLLLIGKNV